MASRKKLIRQERNKARNQRRRNRYHQEVPETMPETHEYITEAPPKKPRHKFEPRTSGQINYVAHIVENIITICIGVAGTGKTHIATVMACEALLRGDIDRIIIARPIVEASENKMGFLPGDVNAKVHPYMIPIFDEMSLYFRPDEVRKMILERKIDIVPLNLMRGRNFHHAFIILDEAQNATYKEIKMFLSRIGTNTKAIINGDTDQTDIENSGLMRTVDALEGAEDIGVCELTTADIQRSRIVNTVLTRMK